MDKLAINPDITALCDACSEGDERAMGQLFELVYDELQVIAHSHRRRWQGNETLNTTALIHETYLKLAKQVDPNWAGRSHFFATAAKAMRHILVNYAQRSNAAKRGGAAEHTDRVDEFPIADTALPELLSLHQALEALEQVHPRRCRVVECRIFGGMSNEQIAEAVGISIATVKRDWTLARAELYQQLGAEPSVTKSDTIEPNTSESL